jgi:hypothetical protein
MPKMVKRIKLDSETTGTTEAYLTTDLSDKNVVVDHIAPNMDFRKVVLSGNTFIAINRIDGKIYRNTIGSNVWELLSRTLPTYSTENPVYIQTFKPNIVVIYNLDRFYYSDNSGVTWVSHPVNNCTYVTIHKNSIYYISANRVHRLNYTTGGTVEFTNTSANYIYSLGDVLIATNVSNCYYYDENDNNPATAFKDITAQYSHLLPILTNTSFYTNVSSRYIHGAAEIMQNNDTPPSKINIYNEKIKSITKNNIINNVNLTTNIITSSSKISTDGCYSNQYYIHDDFIIFITGYVLSVSTDGGDTFTSINTGDGIRDVVAHNGVLYIFSGNTVKKIVPSIMDNSNIINKDPNVGYSLVNPKQTGNFGKSGYAKYLNNIEVTPGEKIKINVTAPDGGVRLVWGTNRYFPTNAS